jgi:environmental stress-induced protein Ves
MRIIRQSSFAAVPWRNGGGVTYEAIRVPAGSEPFLWRLSVARIDAAGPFSDFAGYHRFMVLLKGAGVVLRFSARTATAAVGGTAAGRVGEPVRELRSAGDMAEFDGGLAVHCELIQGPCVDLNLMVSKTLSGVQARVEEIGVGDSLPVGRESTTLLFPLDVPAALAGVGGTDLIEPWDVALLSGGEAAQVRTSARGKLFLASLPER